MKNENENDTNAPASPSWGHYSKLANVWASMHGIAQAMLDMAHEDEKKKFDALALEADVLRGARDDQRREEDHAARMAMYAREEEVSAARLRYYAENPPHTDIGDRE